MRRVSFHRDTQAPEQEVCREPPGRLGPFVWTGRCTLTCPGWTSSPGPQADMYTPSPMREVQPASGSHTRARGTARGTAHPQCSPCAEPPKGWEPEASAPWAPLSVESQYRRPSTCTPRVWMEGRGKDPSLLTSHTTTQSSLPFLLTSPGEALLGLWGSQALSRAFSWGQKTTGGRNCLDECQPLPRITYKNDPPTSTQCPVPRSTTLGVGAGRTGHPSQITATLPARCC